MSSSRKRRLAIYETAMVGGAGGVGALKGMSVRLPHDTGPEGWTGYLILAAILVAAAGSVGLIEWWIRRKGITSRDDETVRVVLEELAKQPGRGVGVSP
jgi:peptidoglycan/LPS O-acetylase OafA/YrhL